MPTKNNELTKDVVHVTRDGKRLSAILDNYDNCGRLLTVGELARVDKVLQPYEYNELIVMEFADRTERRDCPDDEYFTNLGAVADDIMEKYCGGGGVH